MIALMTLSIAAGKYLVSPLSRRTDDGQYIASVSIRTGHGQSTHDRVLRFAPLFNSQADAVQFATRQGMHWVDHPAAR